MPNVVEFHDFLNESSAEAAQNLIDSTVNRNIYILVVRLNYSKLNKMCHLQETGCSLILNGMFEI